jgi:YidC/Oxa1 family membrane protein insertase
MRINWKFWSKVIIALLVIGLLVFALVEKINIWHEWVYRPLVNAMVGLYDIIPGKDFGWSIVALTIIIRLILLPLSWRSTKSQLAMRQLQPELERIKQQYKDDPQGLRTAMMSFYKDNKINPLSSCLPLLLSFPILIALYQVFISGLTPAKIGDIHKLLYPFIPFPDTINVLFLGLIDLSKPDKTLVLAILAGGFQFLQSWMIMPKGKTQEAAMSRQMTYMMPVLTIIFSLSLPAGLPLYWIVSTLFSIGQQMLIKPPRAPSVITVKTR